MTSTPADAKRPGKINPDAGEPEKGAPDVGEKSPPHGEDAHDGDEPFPPAPGSADDLSRKGE